MIEPDVYWLDRKTHQIKNTALIRFVLAGLNIANRRVKIDMENKTTTLCRTYTHISYAIRI
jgi:hypothetical protein